MPIPNPKYVDELNELAKLCSDSAESYWRAAETVPKPRFAAFCKRRAEDRDLVAGQFRQRIEQLGQEPDEGGTLRGVADKLVSEASGQLGDEQSALLSELLQIDGRLKERFETFLEGSLPPGTEEIIKENYERVAKGYNDLRKLADQDGA